VLEEAKFAELPGRLTEACDATRELNEKVDQVANCYN
jgi:hypothetical protein